jgi:catechol 2,3-dioxygenase-like lactoylglutathione lyase family enzyme
MTTDTGAPELEFGAARANRCEEGCMATITGFHHVGMVARDPDALAAFYRDVLGMTVTGGSDEDSPFGHTAFLSSRPEDEDHELAIFANPVFRHFAFKVASLDALRAVHRRIVERGIPVKMTMNHGCSIAFYFDDPEGNMIEIYWPTGVRNRQPHGDPFDLEAPDSVLIAHVAEIAERAGVPLSPELEAMRVAQ